MPSTRLVALFQLARNPASHAGNVGFDSHARREVCPRRGIGLDATNVGDAVQLCAGVRIDEWGRDLGSAWFPNPSLQRSIRWWPAHVVLASQTANAGSKPKRSRVKVLETTPWRAGSTAVSYAARRGFNSLRCDEDFRGVAKWYRARFGTARPEVRSLSPRRHGGQFTWG